MIGRRFALRGLDRHSADWIAFHSRFPFSIALTGVRVDQVQQLVVHGFRLG